MLDQPILVEQVVSRRSQLGEGAFWDHRRGLLFWVDILGEKVFAFDPKTSINREWSSGAMVGTVVPSLAGDLILARQDDIVRLDLVTGELTAFVPLEDARSDMRFNDGKCDPAGRLWVGRMNQDGKTDDGALYCLEADARIERRLEPTTVSNGIIWSRDRSRMYYIDSERNDVRVWDFEESSGRIENERIAFRNDHSGVFDGMTIDTEGMLWIAIFEGGEVRRYDPRDGRVLQVVRLPARQITSCAFGGPELKDLYITSGSEHYTEEDWREDPQAGSLFRIRPGATGIQLPYFGG